eukprot:TRINITY_DN2732_c0_g1_i4.p1 TRINITY_DN2732_c0_g1~~TRINITY_DN2732_c0_g1_i4.p1  ORF type:complete len:296 (+),score=63.17 TRINITY_DN2732_c0_g1_i4:178-1065(+)
MDMESSDIFNYSNDPFLNYPPTFSFDEETVQRDLFRSPLFEAAPSPSTDPPEDSFTVENAKAPIVNEKAQARRQRIKEKVSKTKAKYPERKKAIKKVAVPGQKPSLAHRNRLSAQRSRERKREELNMLKQANIELERAKIEAEDRLALVTSELESMKTAVSLLSPESHDEFTRIHASLSETSPTSASRRKHRAPLLLAGALFGCICVVCCLLPFPYTDESASPSRLLLNHNAVQCPQVEEMEIFSADWQSAREVGDRGLSGGCGDVYREGEGYEECSRACSLVSASDSNGFLLLL